MRTYALSAQDLTRRLVASETAKSDATSESAHAAQLASERACRQLSRSLGSSGFNALLMRALAQAEDEHPLLKGITIGRNGSTCLGGIPGLVESHGSAAVTAGLETMLSTMFGLLGRLIGDDMVPRLIEGPAQDATYDDEEVK